MQEWSKKEATRGRDGMERAPRGEMANVRNIGGKWAGVEQKKDAKGC